MAAGALVYDILARDHASKVFDKVGQSAERAGNKTHKFGLVSKLGAAAGAGGLGGLAIQSIKTAAAFETTMRQIAVATDAPAASLQGLSKLALKMGQDTVFSAQEAGDAMLELAKSGMSEADIRAGALAQTLTLASAGGLQLADAAGYISTGLAVFSLKASQSSEVAAALAGAANATKASVQDVGYALAQGGAAAANAGLSIQEATAAIAVMAKYGNLGSDAGTSLKTMFSRLVPQTSSAAVAMARLGLKFTDAHGDFLSLADIAGELHDKLGPLSKEERTLAINTIFGSDAQRAALNLMREGRKGVEAMTRATSDQTQAQKLADATTSGTAGALSQLSGSIDTAKLALGTALAPLVVKVAGHLTGFANALGTDVIPALGRFIDGMDKGTGPGGKFAGVLGDLGDAAKSAWDTAKPLFGFIGDHPKLFAEVAKDAGLLALALKGVSTVKKLPGVGSLLGGGRGGVLGGITKAAPLPVFVVNQLPGVGTGGLPLPGGTVGKEAGKVGKVATVGKTLGALTGPTAAIPLILTVDATTREFMQRETDAERKKQIAQLQTLAATATTPAQLASVIKAADALAKNTHTVVKDGAIFVDPKVQATLRDVGFTAAKVGIDARKKLRLLDPKQSQADTDQLNRQIKLISGGLLDIGDFADESGQKTTKALSRISKGAINAHERMFDLRDSVKSIPDAKPKVQLVGAEQTNGWIDQLYGGLARVDAKKPRPSIALVGASTAERDSTRIEAALDRLKGLHVHSYVDIIPQISQGLINRHEKEGGPRARGGSVYPGRTYTINEEGWERFEPSVVGRMVPASQTAATGTGAPPISLTINEAGHTPEEFLPRVMSNVAFLHGS